ncbi:MAG: protoporphyrinogen oxidase [Longimicrobiales bacterium]
MIAVVGGGITGLALGWHLERLGMEYAVFEAQPRVGGVVRTGTVDGHVLDRGPQRLRLTPAMAGLVADLGLSDRMITAPDGLRLHVYRGGRLHPVPTSAIELLRTTALSPAARLRLLVEPLTRGVEPGEHVAEYFERKVGREVYRTLVAPLYGGLYGTDPASMDVEVALLPLLRRLGVRRSLLMRFLRGTRGPGAPAVSFRDGMEELPRALARALPGRVHTGSPVRSLARRGAGWRLDVGGAAIDARVVVVTTPPAPTGRLLTDAAPELGAAASRLRTNCIGVVHLHARTELQGLGFQVSHQEADRTLRGVTFNDALFGRTGVYTAYLGAGTDGPAGGPDDDALASTAVSRFRACTGYESRPLAVARAWMPAWDRTWRGLHDVPMPPGLHVAANWWSRPGLAGRLAEAESLARRLAAGAPMAAHGRVA